MTEPIARFGSAALDAEHEANFQAYQRLLPELLAKHSIGHHAVLRHGELFEVMDTLLDAVKLGLRTFPDRLFSVHPIVADPVIRIGPHFADPDLPA